MLSLYCWKIFLGNRRHVFLAVAGVLAVTALVVPFEAVASRIAYGGWGVYAALVIFLVKVDHPPVYDRTPLTPTRRALGYLCIVIFLPLLQL